MRVSSLSGPSQATVDPQAVAARAPAKPAESLASPAQSPAPAALSEALSRTRNAVREVASNLEFSVDNGTGKTIVRIVDASTQELIRQIPSEEMLSIARNLDRIEGLLIKSKA